MGEHRAASRGGVLATLRSTRVRALLALGVLIGFGSVNTMAYWTDSATISGGTLQSGRLDLKVNDSDGNPEAYPWTAFTLTNMVPGESIAAALPIQNKGSVDFNYTASAVGSGDLLPHLTFTLFTGGAASNSTSGSGLRQGTCGGTATGTKTLTATPQPVISTPRKLVAATGVETVCVVARLPLAADDAAQGESATATFTFNAKQVGAP